MIVECPGCRSRYDVSGRPPGTRARCRCGTVFALPDPPQSADYLRCPACDAAVSPQAVRCDYCETALLVRACPRCFCRVFHGARHCRHCGAQVEAPAATDAEGTATRRVCPRCADPGVTLEGRLVAECLLDECNRCGGVYVDAATLERIIEDRRQVGAALATSSGPARTTGQIAAQPQSGPMYVSCPDCEQLMNRTNFGRGSGIIVDVCKFHGTWFDADELPRVIEFVRTGGLEQAERRALEREREELRRQKQRTASLPADPDMFLEGRGRRSNAVGLAAVLHDVARWLTR